MWQIPALRLDRFIIPLDMIFPALILSEINFIKLPNSLELADLSFAADKTLYISLPGHLYLFIAVIG